MTPSGHARIERDLNPAGQVSPRLGKKCETSMRYQWRSSVAHAGGLGVRPWGIAMPVLTHLSQGLLIVAAAVCVRLAWTDVRQDHISNGAVLVLAVLFFLHAAVSGRWTEAHWNVVFAAVMLVPMMFCFVRGIMGGGSAKLLLVAFLWVGLGGAPVFAIMTLVFVLLYVGAARLGLIRSRTREADGWRIAFAPPVAAALIGVFILGGLAPIA